MKSSGFNVKEGVTPIVPVMLGDARLASELAAGMLAEGIYVIGFSFPVVPKGEARIRVQLSAGHTEEQVDRAIEAFKKVGKAKGVI
jgi:glycine C-acetyltransferase